MKLFFLLTAISLGLYCCRWQLTLNALNDFFDSELAKIFALTNRLEVLFRSQIRKKIVKTVKLVLKQKHQHWAFTKQQKRFNAELLKILSLLVLHLLSACQVAR